MHKFYSTAYDLYVSSVFVKYSNKGKGELYDTIREMSKGGIIRSFKYALIAIVIMILQSLIRLIDNPITNIIANGLLIVFFVLIISAFYNVRKKNKEYISFIDSFMNRPQSLDERVMLYDVHNHGIYLNMYNKTDYNDMIYIAWDGIIKCEVGVLTYPGGKQPKNARHQMLRKSKEIRKHHPDFKHFRYPAQSIDLKNLGITLVTDSMYSSTYDYIPIPTKWSKDEVANFLTTIEQYIDVEITQRDKIDLINVVKKAIIK